LYPRGAAAPTFSLIICARLVGRVASVLLTRRGAGVITATGERSASFGHRIPLPDGDADGVYAGWHWDGAQLAIETDRYGMYPLFASTTRDTCVIATDLEAVLDLGAARALDYDALAVFLRVGFFLGSDTAFSAVRAVPPRAVLEWTADGPRLSPRLPPAQRHAFTRDDAIDGFAETFRRAIARRLPRGDFQVPLSGGRDSRHIVLALLEAGAPPSACVTISHFPPRGGDDVAVAADLCDRVRIPHLVLRQRRDRLRAEREKNRCTHFCTDEHAQFMVLADHLRASTRETYDGIAGDVLSQSGYLNREIHARFERRHARAVAEYILDGYGTSVSDAALQRLLAPRLFREVSRERALHRLEQEVLAHAGAPNPTSSFFFWNRTRREVALSPFGVMRPITVYAPYLDRDVFDLLAGLPASMLMDRMLHTDTIARAYPAAAGLRYEARAPLADSRGMRGLAVQLAALATSQRSMLRPATLIPGLAATAVDGRAQRMWHVPLTIYLHQLAALASARAT
jgi:hypothetical protein